MALSTSDIRNILKSLGAEKVEVYSGGVRCRALHREDRNPSLSIFKGRDGNWVVKDHGTGESWSLYSYLLRIGLGADEAREMLGLGQWERREKPKDQPLSWLKRVVDIQRPVPNPHPLSDEAVRKVEEAWTEALSRLGDERLTKYLQERGFSPEKAADLGLGVDEKGNIIIPTFDPDGRPRNLQVRKAKGEPRYYFIFSGHEGGYYMAGELERPSLVQLVEGPLNAASLALIRQVENEAYIGVPGASHGLTEALVERLRQWGAPIIIWVDADDAGRRAREKWVETLLAAGFERRNILIPHEDHGHRDINDILRKDPKPHETIARLLVRSKHVSNRRGVKHLARMALEVGAKSLRGISTALGIHNVRFARMGTAPYAALHSEATAKTL
ncbi:MAG: toprim domain-containing protein, partial [Hydrogenophilus sp.]|nr:toprim domain-containing protein [Hydrogenophilus sp.]